jgi:gamma-glutamylcyclotransferase (GGCT)/AIG2-like uncharacterized protein YtfP
VTERVFVYGTLKPGQGRWSVLAPFVLPTGDDGASAVSGLLYDTGYGWPAAVFDTAAGADVPGTVLTLRPESVAQALDTLDAVEGVRSGLFHRMLVEVDGQSCWAYHWPGPVAGFQRIRCWPLNATGR